ncbi:MAG: DNA topoisomerase, partial [Myxococcales bacterium]|nr:DNA topoisomerase [Polyangiaceae bacterium]MDW8251513.1 DNA topoisomerase [Myxococcales bacterium]
SALYAPFTTKLLAAPPGPTPRVFNNARVTDHHAIIPTSKTPPASLDRDHQRIHDLIVRRFLGAFFPDAEFALTSLTILVGHDAPLPPLPDPPPTRDALLEALPPPPDRFFARGKVLLSPGWREVAGFDENEEDYGKKDEEEATQRLPPLTQGQHLYGTFSHVQKRTRPPPRYTEASLLSAMEFAGRDIEDDALRQALKERGLGTPATRASIIETLLRRGYLKRQQKSLMPTPLGFSLLDLLPVQSLASPELTGEWEARLARMARGEESRQHFMSDILKYVREIVEQVRTSPSSIPFPRTGRGGSGHEHSAKGTSPPISPSSQANSIPLHCPHCLDGRIIPGKHAWGCSRWREGCRLVIPFEFGGKKLSKKHLQELIMTGQTGRRTSWKQDGREWKGKLHLDLQSNPPALRIQP